MRMLIHCLTMLGFMTFAGRAAAHHSFAAEFAYDLFGVIEGEVIEVHFVNPHTRVFITVVNENGEEEIWDAQTHSVSILFRAGWGRNAIRIGERVVLEGNLGRNNTRKLWIRTVTLENGTVLNPNSGVTVNPNSGVTIYNER